MARHAGSSARTCSDDHPESIHNALRAAAGASQKSIPGSLRTSSQELRPFPQDISIMTEAQLDAALAKGYEDLKEGRTIPAGQAFVELRREFGV